jgi:thiazole synthase
MMELFHCFGAKPEHRVDADLAVDMLRASGCRYLAVNTHNIDDLDNGDDLPIGYWTATFGSVRKMTDGEIDLTPVLNINHPTTEAEAVRRARRAVELTGVRIIKLEVLDDGLTESSNDAVVAAARTLIGDGLEVWPLITADRAAFDACVGLGCTMVRVMGSPIGARRGIDAGRMRAIESMLADSPVPVMLDGGVGSREHVVAAAAMGFPAILVNSCLFGAGTDPAAMLRDFRTALAETG